MKTSQQTKRGFIEVAGPDASRFLQNLISNDIGILESAPYLHACLLTPQGKFLHDFFITRHNDSYLINCEAGARAENLFERLTLFKLRSPVVITKHDDRDSYFTPYGYNFDDERAAMNLHDWELHRLKLARADGSRDADIGTSTLEELNLTTGAVSYTKGCYVGQELTARMHHRGLAKKHLYAVVFANSAPPRDTELPHKIGIMRSSYASYGLALIRDDIAITLPKSELGFFQILC